MIMMRIYLSSLVQFSFLFSLPLAEAKKCTRSRLSLIETSSNSISLATAITAPFSVSPVLTGIEFSSLNSYGFSTSIINSVSPTLTNIGVPSSSSSFSLSAGISFSVSPTFTTITTSSPSTSDTFTSTEASSSDILPTTSSLSVSDIFTSIVTSTSSSSIILPTSVSFPGTSTTSTGTSSSSVIVVLPTNTISPSSISSDTSTSATIASTSTSSGTTVGPVVTDQAYIDTVIRHHNVHRANHSANAVTWSPSLAETAQKIASSCIYGHNTAVDGGGYGQNIGAGFLSTAMGQFITEGLYNSEVNAYVYFGEEPDLTTLGQWGHFSQIVWKTTASVGCFTSDCSSTGLQNAVGIPPYFTVCNYAPAGNVVGAFTNNIGVGLGAPSVYANYGCPSRANCVN